MLCRCEQRHPRRRLVLTGGPGAGKTAVLELAHHFFCQHVEILPEAAGILFSGGFKRRTSSLARAATQRAIFHIQREIETIAESEDNTALTLCDRGTVDGWAYWPGPDDFFTACDTTRAAELARYDVVIHLRTPRAATGYNHRNPLRTESASEAAAIDERIVAAWAGHPRCSVVESTHSFLDKAEQAIELIRLELPECCRPPKTNLMGPVGRSS